MDTITVQFIDTATDSHYTTEMPTVPRIGEHVSFDYHQIDRLIVGRVVDVHWHIGYFPNVNDPDDIDLQMVCAAVYVEPT